MIQIIDNFLDEEEHREIEKVLLGNNFPWFYYNSIISNEVKDDKNNYQLAHIFYNDFTIKSGYYDIVIPLLSKIKPAALIRIKANLNPNRETPTQYSYHVDVDGKFKAKTAVYYVNTNNGQTIFIDGTKIDSVANRLLIFDKDILHTNTTCTDQKMRCVLNLNYIENKE
jgi:hypothetical protein